MKKRTINEYHVKPFETDIKMYLFKHRQRVKMTVKVTDIFAITYLWNQDQFEEMLSKWRNEWSGKALGADIFVGPKIDGDQRFVRFSSSAQFGCEHRFSYAQMDNLKKEYIRQKSNEMPWDK